MADANFTPGPWEVSQYGSFDTLIRVKGSDGNGRKVAATWVSEARTKRRATETMDEYYLRSRKTHLDRARQNEANAHLIAAAPELYEALREARLALDGLSKGEGVLTPIEKTIRRSEAALAKARGETHA